MTEGKKKSFSFADFAHTYVHSSKFPPEARQHIPPELLTAIDDGNEKYFQEFKAGQPEFYKVLTKQCTDIRLVENVWIDQWAGGVEKKAYFWGLMCGDRLIVCNIPLPSRRPSDKLDALPRELHCYYKKMDGMTMCDEYGRTGVGRDLPRSLSSWPSIEDIRTNFRWRKSVLEKINRDFHNHDVRVVVWSAKADLVLVDYTAKDRELYHVKDGKFDGYHRIENAPKALDRYFANAVLGWPEPFDFKKSG